MSANFAPRYIEIQNNLGALIDRCDDANYHSEASFLRYIEDTIREDTDPKVLDFIESVIVGYDWIN